MKIEVVNLNFNDFEDSEYFYIGRGSSLGNPWTHKKSKYARFKVGSREESIEKYREWIEARLKVYTSPQRLQIDECVKELVKKGELRLGCFCKPLPCHGDVLSEIIMNRAEARKKSLDELFNDFEWQ